MKYLEKIINLLFPKEVSVLELESMFVEDMLSLFPKPEENGVEISALFSYKDKRVKKLIHEIKYNQNKILMRKVGRILSERAMGFFEDSLQFGSKKIQLVPIPSSHSRENMRGYNPPEEIAREIVKNFPESFSLSLVLTKIRETKRQALLPRSERLSNLEGAFAVSANAPDGVALIIDDIYTTGATINEAKCVLKDSNINVVGVLTVAH